MSSASQSIQVLVHPTSLVAPLLLCYSYTPYSYSLAHQTETVTRFIHTRATTHKSLFLPFLIPCGKPTALIEPSRSPHRRASPETVYCPALPCITGGCARGSHPTANSSPARKLMQCRSLLTKAKTRWRTTDDEIRVAHAPGGPGRTSRQRCFCPVSRQCQNI